MAYYGHDSDPTRHVRDSLMFGKLLYMEFLSCAHAGIKQLGLSKASVSATQILPDYEIKGSLDMVVLKTPELKEKVASLCI